jgi:hypothetical protein
MGPIFGFLDFDENHQAFFISEVACVVQIKITIFGRGWLNFSPQEKKTAPLR